jgi:hypothetical protein
VLTFGGFRRRFRDVTLARQRPLLFVVTALSASG